MLALQIGNQITSDKFVHGSHSHLASARWLTMSINIAAVSTAFGKPLKRL